MEGCASRALEVRHGSAYVCVCVCVILRGRTFMRSLCPLLYLGGAATCMVRSSSWTSSRSGITGISGRGKRATAFTRRV